jgi:hypothetical protein
LTASWTNPNRKFPFVEAHKFSHVINAVGDLPTAGKLAMDGAAEKPKFAAVDVAGQFRSRVQEEPGFGRSQGGRHAVVQQTAG